MRKVTQEICQAFMKDEDKKIGNSEVVTYMDTTTLNLHGNEIARKEKDQPEIVIRNAGWFSKTTKERLNGLPGVSISQRKGVWYLNGEEWDGESTIIK